MRPGRRLKIHGEEYLDFATAGYLGLDYDNEVVEVAASALKSLGLGRFASPFFMAPQYYAHIEKEIRRITNFPEVILFSSTSLANLAVIRYALPSNSYFIVDEYSHRSLVEALKGAHHKVLRYPNLNISGLKDILSKTYLPGKPAIISDGVFSMSGATAPSEELSKIVEELNGYLVIDDAHGFGVYGANGEGSLEHIKPPRYEDLIYVGSLTKAIPGSGGFVACSQEVANRIRNKSPQYSFSCSIPLIYAAVTAYSCNLMGSTKWHKLVINLRQNWKILQSGLRKVDRDLMASFSPLAVIKSQNEKELRNVCLTLKKNKIVFNVVGFPAVPKGDFRIRFCLSASHAASDIYFLVNTLTEALRACNKT